MTLSDPMPLPCGATLQNRIAKSAMSERLATLSRRAPTDALCTLYRRWSEGGAGLLITGNVMIDPMRLAETGNVAVQDDEHLALLQRWAAAATSAGNHAWAQINHPGRQAPRPLDPKPVAPSVVPMKGAWGAFSPPRALTEPEILEIIARFARTAFVLQRAGFTGVQVHAAHGYLVSQFLSPYTNRRDDAWGGSLDNRMRFLLEIVSAIRGAVGPAFPVSVKLNSADFQRGGLTNEESMQVAAALERAGIDLLEISGGTYERAVMFVEQKESTIAREAFFLEYAREVRKHTRLPLMVTGGFRSKAAMEAALSEGALDVVGMARPLAFEPDLPARLLDGRAEGAMDVRIHFGIRSVDAMLTGAWYQAQIERIGQGHAPSEQLSRISALSWYVRDVVRGRSMRGWTPLRVESRAAV